MRVEGWKIEIKYLNKVGIGPLIDKNLKEAIADSFPEIGVYSLL